MTLAEKISLLPEGSSAGELAPFFRQCLEGEKTGEVLEALTELADRQWHTYEKLHPDISGPLEEWILAHCDFVSYEEMEHLTSMVAHLSLARVFAKMHERFPELTPEVQASLQSFFAEVGESINDPYSRLQSQMELKEKTGKSGEFGSAG